MRYTEPMNKYSRQSGAAFLYILIAIALIALLSAAMSRGSRTNVTVLTTEQARIAAQEIIDYSSVVANGAQKLRLRGCQDNQFDAYNTVWVNADTSEVHALNHNSNAPSNGSCSLFNANGAKLTASLAPKIATLKDHVSSTGTGVGSYRIQTGAFPGIGTSAEDVALFLPFVDTTVCMKINDLLGVSNNTALPPAHTWNSLITYNGSFPGTKIVTDVEGKFTGKAAFCSYDTVGDNRFWQILIAR